MKSPKTVLFLCTGNSARSILAEALLNRDGGGRFRALSAGSQPKGQVHPMALSLLSEKGFAIEGLRSKSWDEFDEASCQSIDLVVTVCDSAAAETCPVWPGAPLQVHWGIADPAAIDEPAEQRRAFELAYFRMQARISAMLSMADFDIDRDDLLSRLRAIGSIPS